ncbi:hypothetical protein THIARS_80177 [Thiomonas delicata]|uniref:Uncharacterized protein n=1 Tax=Thiomonas delicata TaxID=364030 RepID=A0A238D8K8_THIDL|nr:hypothetical protein THIARS_80177 [Thiomonas delicata]
MAWLKRLAQTTRPNSRRKKGEVLSFPFFVMHEKFVKKSGAGNESRTRDLNLGKVALYQLSYSRETKNYRAKKRPVNAHRWLACPCMPAPA